MRFAKKTICLLLAVLMVAGVFGSVQAEAKEMALPVPKIKVKAINKGTGIKVTILKTKDAEGFEVYACGTDTSYSEFKNVSDDFQKVADVNKNGNAKRTITIKSLSAGLYKIKVRSFNGEKFDTMMYSEFSKVKSVRIKDAANGYKDAYDFSKVKKGDIIKFGTYEQDGNFSNGKEPIEWIVLEKTKKQVFVVSKYTIDCLPYNKEFEYITWENCTLRQWLNNKFYTNAFNKKEKGMIKNTIIENFDNTESGTTGGNDTKDKVFLLSQLEMIKSDYGFDESYDENDVKRRCALTAYAMEQGKIVQGINNVRWKTSDGAYTDGWWLRTSGFRGKYAAYVCADGSVNSDGCVVSFDGIGVRPALYITLKI